MTTANKEGVAAVCVQGDETNVKEGLLPAELAKAALTLGEGAGAMYFSQHSLDAFPSSLPEEPSPSAVVYRHIHDLRLLDAEPRLNLASYVTTWMEEPARQLIMESLSVNHVDGSIYRSSTEIENKCLHILAALWHAENPADVCGTATVGSTESSLLGGLNMKKRWMTARKAKGLSIDKPNLIISDAYQVCWKKFSMYFDVEMKLGKMKEGKYTLTAEDVEQLADENTIGVVAVLGSTYTGHFDDVKAIDQMCDKLRETRGLDLTIHIDGASGGFVAPFLYPDLEWDFKLKNVISIGASGHKYGLVYPGIGWMMWRSNAYLHPDLVFHLSYLGSDQINLTMNFSKPASHIIASLYQFLRLGRTGYKLVARNLQQLAVHLADGIKALGAFRVMNDPHETVPMVSFSLLPYNVTSDDPLITSEQAEAASIISHNGGTMRLRPYTEFEFAEKLKGHGWSVPAYKMAADLQHLVICRCVIREDMSISLINQLIRDMQTSLTWLDAHMSGRSRQDRDQVAELHHPHTAPSTLKRKDKMHVVC